jgi:hypothetical protein
MHDCIAFNNTPHVINSFEVVRLSRLECIVIFNIVVGILDHRSAAARGLRDRSGSGASRYINLR